MLNAASANADTAVRIIAMNKDKRLNTMIADDYQGLSV